jgi:hypothetical protein
MRSETLESLTGTWYALLSSRVNSEPSLTSIDFFDLKYNVV